MIVECKGISKTDFSYKSNKGNTDTLTTNLETLNRFESLHRYAMQKSGKSYSSSKETTTEESILGQPSEYCNWHLLGLIALNELFAGCLSITCRRCPTKENCIQIGAVLDSYRVFLVCLQEQNSPNTVSSL